MGRERGKDDTLHCYIFPCVSLVGVRMPEKRITCYGWPSVSILKGNLLNWKKVVTGKRELVIYSLHPRTEIASNHRITVAEAPCKWLCVRLLTDFFNSKNLFSHFFLKRTLKNLYNNVTHKIRLKKESSLSRGNKYGNQEVQDLHKIWP